MFKMCLGFFLIEETGFKLLGEVVRFLCIMVVRRFGTVCMSFSMYSAN